MRTCAKRHTGDRSHEQLRVLDALVSSVSPDSINHHQQQHMPGRRGGCVSFCRARGGGGGREEWGGGGGKKRKGFVSMPEGTSPENQKTM